jgi:hypothetical protein
MCERGLTGGDLNLSYTSYPDHGRYGDLPLKGKISTTEPGIEPGTSWLVVRSSDHKTTRLVCLGSILRYSSAQHFYQIVSQLRYHKYLCEKIFAD